MLFWYLQYKRGMDILERVTLKGEDDDEIEASHIWGETERAVDLVKRRLRGNLTKVYKDLVRIYTLGGRGGERRRSRLD